MSNVSKSLRSLTKNERCEQNNQVAHQKWTNCSGRLPKMSNHEQIAQAANQKWATMGDLLRSLTNNERIAHFLSKLLIRSLFAHLKKPERFALKTDEQIPNPGLDH